MRLPVLFSIITITISGCGHLPLPDKPKIEMGVIDASDKNNVQVISNKLNTQKVVSEDQLNYKALVKALIESKFVRKPVAEYDKAIVIPPKSWEALENYRNKLEDYARNRCQF